MGVGEGEGKGGGEGVGAWVREGEGERERKEEPGTNYHRLSWQVNLKNNPCPLARRSPQMILRPCNDHWLLPCSIYWHLTHLISLRHIPLFSGIESFKFKSTYAWLNQEIKVQV